MRIKKYLFILPLFVLFFYYGCESNDAVTTSVYIPQPVNKKILVEFYKNDELVFSIKTKKNILSEIKVFETILHQYGDSPDCTMYQTYSIYSETKNFEKSIYNCDWKGWEQLKKIIKK